MFNLGNVCRIPCTTMNVNQNTHNIGSVHLEQDHGMIWMTRANYVGYDKIVCSSASLAKATLSPDAKIFYKNKTIGDLHSVQYNNKDGFLIGFFSSFVSRDSLPSDDRLFASVKYESNGIQCIRCQRFFQINSDSCECIDDAPAIQIPTINILGASIHDGMYDNINMFDARPDLLKKYFGGIVSLIKPDEGF